jgi:hypothetical protein
VLSCEALENRLPNQPSPHAEIYEQAVMADQEQRAMLY